MAFDVAPPKRDIPRVSARTHERDAIWRLCSWGGSAALALGALAITIQSDLGRRRIDVLVGNGPPPPPAVIAQPAPRPPEKDPETLRLQAEVRSLTADRERLAARFAALERQIEEVTGSIQQVSPPAATSQATAPPPQVAPVSAAPAAPPAVAKPAIPIIDPLAMPVITGSVGGWPGGAGQQEHEEEPVRVAPLETAEVPHAPVPLAAIPSQELVVPATPRAAAKVEYGIDLGGARDMDALRQRWAAIKANLGPLLTGLQPVAVRDRKPGSTELRLVVGPMPSLTAARQVCARFTSAHVTCHAAKFNGEAIVQR